MPESERRDLARRHLDSAEHWLRRLIDSELSSTYGPKYFGSVSPADGLPLIKKAIRDRVYQRRTAEPAQYARDIDATTLEDAISIVLNPRLFKQHFEGALKGAYSDRNTAEVARIFLFRLRDHRNPLSHGGTCSARALEQCVCYSNDLIDALKVYFVRLNMERIFNVPTFTRVVDNRGNDIPLSSREGHHFIDLKKVGAADLSIGDTLVIEAEVDESFTGWHVHWITFNGDRGEGTKIVLPIEAKHVGIRMDVRFHLVSKEAWHRLHGGCDDMLDLQYRVLPPGP